MNSNSSNQPPRIRLGRGGPGGMGRALAFREKPKNAKVTLSRLSSYLGKNKYLLLALFIVMFIASILNLLSPVLQGEAIDAMIVRDSLSIQILDGNWVVNDINYGKASSPERSLQGTFTLEISDVSTLIINGQETLISIIDENKSDTTYLPIVIGEDGFITIGSTITPIQVFPDGTVEQSLTINIKPSRFWVINDQVTKDHAIGAKDPNTLLFLLVILFIILMLNVLLNFMRGFISAYLSERTVKKMRKDLFEHLVYLPVSYFDTHYHGDIMSRMTNDVDSISHTISQALASIFSGVITIIGALIIMLIYSIRLTIISSLSLILTLIITRIMSKYLGNLFRRNQQLLGELNGQVEEAVTGHRTVTAFNKADDLERVFNHTSAQLRKSFIRAQSFAFSMNPIMRIINNLSFLLIVGFGTYFVYKGIDSLTIGTIIIFTSASKQFSRPINEIATLYVQIQTSVAAAERVFEVMDTSKEVNSGNVAMQEKVGIIEFNHVDFSYNKDEPVIQDFSLTVQPGQKIALVGATGSGKTTIVNLLMRFYDIDQGSITIDGVDIRNIDKNELRKAIAIVLQDTILFSTTIENNIRYGNLEADREEIRKATQFSNANVFIERLPGGYQTVLSESGSNLSQGERQLLAIARAVLADPKILILDEATSSVDTRTEKQIQDAMVALMKNRTSLIIAHRLSTIRDADLIVVIDHGRVVETGKHEELLDQKGIYYQLYLRQFGGHTI